MWRPLPSAVAAARSAAGAAIGGAVTAEGSGHHNSGHHNSGHHNSGHHNETLAPDHYQRHVVHRLADLCDDFFRRARGFQHFLQSGDAEVGA